ncbi:MAG: HypC/HybG/HupF family hydrogenase formation chaperone [Acidimicrobiales bacterium]
MCLGVPGQVTSIDDAAALATGIVDFGGARREVCLAFVPEVQVGDHVLVHVGFALSVLDPDDAARTRALLAEIGAVDDP